MTTIELLKTYCRAQTDERWRWVGNAATNDERVLLFRLGELAGSGSTEAKEFGHRILLDTPVDDQFKVQVAGWVEEC